MKRRRAAALPWRRVPSVRAALAYTTAHLEELQDDL